MEWTDVHRVGIRDIDEQHQEIVWCISGIDQAVTRREGWFVVRAGLDDLENLARLHFKVEESLMQIHDLPDLEAHAGDHLRFSAELKTLRELALANLVSQDRLHRLLQWWDEHIEKHDKPYAFQFLKRTTLGKP